MSKIIEIPKSAKYVKKWRDLDCDFCSGSLDAIKGKTRYRCSVCDVPLHECCVDYHYTLWEHADDTHDWGELRAYWRTQPKLLKGPPKTVP